jgi:integrase
MSDLISADPAALAAQLPANGARASDHRVKQRAAQAGYDPAPFSGHSLRAGLAAAAAGAPYHAIKKQTGHRSDQMLQRYIRDGSLFRENAAAQVGL